MFPYHYSVNLYVCEMCTLCRPSTVQASIAFMPLCSLKSVMTYNGRCQSDHFHIKVRGMSEVGGSKRERDRERARERLNLVSKTILLSVLLCM